jgi:hypothetical protein
MTAADKHKNVNPDVEDVSHHNGTYPSALKTFKFFSHCKGGSRNLKRGRVQMLK